jgi:hypothetical protein
MFFVNCKYERPKVPEIHRNAHRTAGLQREAILTLGASFDILGRVYADFSL